MKKLLVPLLLFFTFSICHAQEKYTLSKSFEEIQKKIQDNYYKYEKLDESLLMANELLAISKNPLEKGIAHYEKVHILLNSSVDYNSGEIALPIGFEAAKVFQSINEREWMHKTWNLLSTCYLKKYNPNDEVSGKEKVEKYRIIALKIQTDSNFMPSVPFYDTFEDTKASQKTIMESIKITEENLKMWEKRNSTPHKMWRNQNLGQLYWYLYKDFKQSEKYLIKALQFARIIKDKSFEHTISLQLAVYANISSNYEKAKIYGEENLKNAIFLKNEIYEAGIRDQLFISYKALGDNNKALSHKIRSIEITEVLTRNTESNRNKQFKERNVILEKQVGLQEELKKQNAYKWILSFVIGMLVLGMCFMFYYNRSLKKKNEEISAAMLQGKTIERQRVASDLHDNIGSTLSALWLSIDNIDKSKMSKKDISLIDMLRLNLEKAYDDVRLLSHNLLPKALEKKGLTAALKGLVAKVNQTSSVYFNLDIDTEFSKLSNTIEFEIYSIILELVNNIMKHAQATEAFIILKIKDKEVIMEVSDNGLGYAEPDVSGFGFDNIAARVETIHGVWKAENNTGKGVKNTIQIPI